MTRSGGLLTMEFRRFTSWLHAFFLMNGAISAPALLLLPIWVFQAEGWVIRLTYFALWVAAVLVAGIPALAVLLAKTTVTVGNGTFSVAYKPVAKRTISFETTGFQQLYCREQTQRVRFGRLLHRYSIHAIADNANLTLVARVWSKAHALYVEKETERFLGLPDRYVHGGV